MSNEESALKKCIDCGQTGHNSAACNNGKVGILYLFGVRIDPRANQSEDDDGYLQVVNGVCSSKYDPKSIELLKINNNVEYQLPPADEHRHDKNKGLPWTEEEHRSFLAGLEQLGKGHWRAISKDYVPSRTPTQVASHAQKFFIRMKLREDKRKRRSSLFDMQLNEFATTPGASIRPPVAPMAQTYGVEGYNRLPDMIGYDRNDHIPSVNYMFEESIHPLAPRTKHFAALVSRPLPITNGKRL